MKFSYAKSWEEFVCFSLQKWSTGGHGEAYLAQHAANLISKHTFITTHIYNIDIYIHFPGSRGTYMIYIPIHACVNT